VGGCQGRRFCHLVWVNLCEDCSSIILDSCCPLLDLLSLQSCGISSSIIDASGTALRRLSEHVVLERPVH